MKRRRSLYVAVLMTAELLYFTNETFHSKTTELVLVFSSNSVESISGFINNSGSLKAVLSVVLTVFQMVVFPFDTKEMIFAYRKVFPGWGGYILSVLGRVLGALFCYDLGRCFLSSLFQRIKSLLPLKFSGRWKRGIAPALLLRIAPLNGSLASYISGGAGVLFREYLLLSLLWSGILTGAYFLQGGYFSHSTERILTVLRIASTGVIFLYFSKKRRRDDSS